MFRFLLRLADGEPFDPPAFVTVVPNWSVGEVVMLGQDEHTASSGSTARSPRSFVEQGFNGVWYVDPA